MAVTRKIKRSDWRIIIPSYKREETIQKKTLATLASYNIPKSKITIVVADEEQKKLYESVLPDYTIVKGVPGLAPVRNFILDNLAKKGEKIVMMDDDVTGFVERTDDGKMTKLGNLNNIIELGFKEAEKAGACLWGVYPVPNGFFMKPTVTSDLKFVIGSFWGIINPTATKDPKGIKLPMSEKEDYIRTMMCWERDKAVVRINYVSPKTAYYKEPGGMQTDPKRLENQKKAVEYMLEKWPNLIMLNPRRKSDYPEVLLRRGQGTLEG
jgi:cellulose synthase/poly-beta-1,6-N-acetylglucosamine synthase-like glycosyltransferase